MKKIKIFLFLFVIVGLLSGCSYQLNNVSKIENNNSNQQQTATNNQPNPGSKIVNATTTPSKFEDLAKCLTAKGAKFYGASWCSHCQNQKATFTGAAKYLPYIECADGGGQSFACSAAKIESYPTWKFADGTTQSGELSLEVLAQKTGCSLPN